MRTMTPDEKRKSWENKTSLFIARASMKFFNKYSYEKVVYKGVNKKVEIICPVHGNFWQLPSNHLSQIIGCPKCSLAGAAQKRSKKTLYFIKKARSFHGDKYDYSKAEYKHHNEKVMIGCKVHGFFLQRAYIHYYSGCRKCSDEKYCQNFKKPLHEFIKEAHNKHLNFYDYSEVLYKNKSTHIKIICPLHGPFYQGPQTHLRSLCRKACPSCPKNKSSQEVTICKILDRLNILFISGYKEILKPKEIDIYIPEFKVGIECNGLFWHSEFCGKFKGKSKDYHLNKTAKCKEMGVSLIHLLENDIAFKEKIIKSLIKRYLNTGKKVISNHKCEIKEIQRDRKINFLNKYEINGNCNSMLNYGIFYKNRLISVFTANKYKDNKIRIVRLSEVFNFSVDKSFDFIEDYLRKQGYKILQVKLNNNWSRSDIPVNKMSIKKRISPKPFYHQNDKHGPQKILNQRQFINKLKKQGKYDDNISIAENCVNNKWNRIWDTGSTIYEKQL